MIVWPHGMNEFFPVCDYVLVERDVKRLLGRTKRETGLARYDDVVQVLAPFLHERETPAGRIKVLVNDGSEIGEIVRRLNLTPIQIDQLTRIKANDVHGVVVH